jgi:formyltetrahydrofolate deformylase
MKTRSILTLSCPDQPGIVHAVTGFLLQYGGNILESAQFDATESNQFFMRVEFTAEGTAAQMSEAFAPIAKKFAMQSQFFDASARVKTLIMVSKLGHCLNDLLFRWKTGVLPIEPVAVVSNHMDYYQLAASYNVAFHHVPITAETKESAEAKLLELVRTHQADLVVLARYMQVLTDNMCVQLQGRAINIHHSFLPSFKGAKPYAQAFERGVKLIGATAHYVTPALDEGPIIEQDVERVDHRMSPEDLTNAGRDVESRVLARAVSWHAQHRVIMSGNKTVVFR